MDRDKHKEERTRDQSPDWPDSSFVAYILDSPDSERRSRPGTPAEGERPESSCARPPVPEVSEPLVEAPGEEDAEAIAVEEGDNVPVPMEVIFAEPVIGSEPLEEAIMVVSDVPSMQIPEDLSSTINLPVPVEPDQVSRPTINTDRKKKSPTFKVIIRRLPPDLKEEQFVSQITPMPNYTSFYYVPGDSTAFPVQHARAYFSFANLSDVYAFKEKFDNYLFLDARGGEHIAVVEFAPFQRAPKQSPPPARRDAKCDTLTTDPTFNKYMIDSTQESTETQDSKPEYSFQLKDESKKPSIVVTPLVEFVNARKSDRNRRDDRRDERRKRDDIRKRTKEEERRQRRVASYEPKSEKKETSSDEPRPQSASFDPKPSTSGEPSQKKKSSGQRIIESSYKQGVYRPGSRDGDKSAKAKTESGAGKSSEDRPGSSGYSSGQRQFKQPGRFQSGDKTRPPRDNYNDKPKRGKSKGVFYASNAPHGPGRQTTKLRASTTSYNLDVVTERNPSGIEEATSPRQDRSDTASIASSRTLVPEDTASDVTLVQDMFPEAIPEIPDDPIPQAAAVQPDASSKPISPKKEMPPKGKSGIPISSKSSEAKSSDKFKDDPRKERRIKNKDRPAMAIYRPGMGRFSKDRKSGDTPPSDQPEDPSKPGPSKQ